MSTDDRRQRLSALIARATAARLPHNNGWSSRQDDVLTVIALIYQRSLAIEELAQLVPFPARLHAIVQDAVKRGYLTQPDVRGRYSVTATGGDLLDHFYDHYLTPLVLAPSAQLTELVPQRVTEAGPFWSAARSPQPVLLPDDWRSIAPTRVELCRRLVGVGSSDLLTRTAALVPMSRSTLRRILGGEREPTIRELQAIASALGVQPWYRLVDEPDSPPVGTEGSWLRLLA